MSADVVPITGALMSPADEAHRRLRRAVAALAEDQWAVADAIHAAHEAEAWNHDDRTSRDRYEVVMRREGLTSMFEAYVLVEFDVRRNPAHFLDLVGRARASTSSHEEVDWSRFTPGALRRVSAGVLNIYEGDDIAAALVEAQRMASAKLLQRADETPQAFEARRDSAPVSGGLVAKALVGRGLVVQRPPGVEVDAVDMRDIKLTKLAETTAAGLATLIGERRRAAAVSIIVEGIQRLADHTSSLDKIRAALDELAT